MSTVCQIGVGHLLGSSLVLCEDLLVVPFLLGQDDGVQGLLLGIQEPELKRKISHFKTIVFPK